jgi:predicted acylesterase/phospholipase RssA
MVALASCAALPDRHPPDEAVYEAAQIPGLPDIRIWGDSGPEEMEEWIRITWANEALQELLADAIAANRPLERNLLALSGGAEDGAFGAGLLNGWTESGQRPEFAVVTGISTGALIAPFAFLGPDYDDELREVFTTLEQDKVLSLQILSGLLGGLALADNDPLRETISRYATQEMLDAIAAEYRKGRGLLIGTTNLDAGRTVIWSIGALANSGDWRALRLFRDILLASASVPGAFPPVLFEVEAGGETYDEMHVDGGVGSQVFAYPPSVSLNAIGADLGVPVKQTLYVVRNAKLAASYQGVEPRLGKIAARSLIVLIKHQGIGDVFRIYALAKRDNVDFRLAFIPPEFDVESKKPFDRNYMSALYDLGYEIGRSGDFWLEEPPGVIPWDLSQTRLRHGLRPTERTVRQQRRQRCAMP